MHGLHGPFLLAMRVVNEDSGGGVRAVVNPVPFYDLGQAEPRLGPAPCSTSRQSSSRTVERRQLTKI